MAETLGTLELKIFRLQHQLKVLQQQQQLCAAYPDYQAHLAQKMLRVQSQLTELVQYREELSYRIDLIEGAFDGNRQKQRTLYPIS